MHYDFEVVGAVKKLQWGREQQREIWRLQEMSGSMDE